MNKNRWLIAVSAIAIHLSIGGAYAYSVYKLPIVEEMGWSETKVTDRVYYYDGASRFCSSIVW